MCCGRVGHPREVLVFPVGSLLGPPGLSALGAGAWPRTLVLPGLTAPHPPQRLGQVGGLAVCERTGSPVGGRDRPGIRRLLQWPKQRVLVAWSWGGGRGKRKVDELKLYLGDKIFTNQWWLGQRVRGRREVIRVSPEIPTCSAGQRPVGR